ncbi:hypothetical protein WJX72_009053 [[Myrmecia] bisecta]|uniref:Uncharacterized protein n=1 Tax=[Myrmecia] bisecta TaxID=41462 RepID=A0AAW1QFY6_9CHLO
MQLRQQSCPVPGPADEVVWSALTDMSRAASVQALPAMREQPGRESLPSVSNQSAKRPPTGRLEAGVGSVRSLKRCETEAALTASARQEQQLRPGICQRAHTCPADVFMVPSVAPLPMSRVAPHSQGPQGSWTERVLYRHAAATEWRLLADEPAACLPSAHCPLALPTDGITQLLLNGDGLPPASGQAGIPSRSFNRPLRQSGGGSSGKHAPDSLFAAITLNRQQERRALEGSPLEEDLEEAAAAAGWTCDFLRRWKQVRARAFLQANGVLLESLNRSSSHNALDLLVHDTTIADEWLRRTLDSQAGATTQEPCHNALHRDPSLATLLREEAEVC